MIGKADTRRVRVIDLMHRGVITCPPGASIGDIAELLARERIHAVFVAGDDGKPIGVVTDFDLLAGEWLGEDGENLAIMRRMTAGELMSAPPEVVEADATAREAADRLDRRHIGRLLVLDHGSAVGVITVSDLIAGLGYRHTRSRTVGAVMSRAIVTCRPEVPIDAAARAMAERRSRSIVVLDQGGAVIGVITGQDLLKLYCEPEAGTVVEDLMTRELRTISADASLREAADPMLEQEVHRLVVLDADHPQHVPLGLVSTSDIATEMAESGSVWRSGSPPSTGGEARAP